MFPSSVPLQWQKKTSNRFKCFPGSGWEPCPVSRLLQFHDRYLEYLMLARELELNPDLPPGSKRLDSLTYEERQAIIEVNEHHPIAISLLI